MDNCKEVLSLHKLRITPFRCELLDILKGEKKGITLDEIGDQLPSDFDRVTLYRTLKTFESSQIIHRVNDLEGNTRYCFNSQQDISNKAIHLHFHCKECDTMQCVDEDNLKFSIPSNFKVDSVQFMVTGVCGTCSNL
jgi:Fur family transcriptional regulator, ferric uptake regulator